LKIIPLALNYYLDVVKPDISVPGGDEEELRGAWSELDSRNSIIGAVLELELATVRVRHFLGGRTRRNFEKQMGTVNRRYKCFVLK